MKKQLTLLALIIAVAFTLCGCKYPYSITDKETKLADDTLDTILIACENRDSDLLRDAFSEKAINEDESLDPEIEELFNFYDGKEVAVKNIGSASKDYADAEDGIYKRIGYNYIVTTDKDEYVISFTKVLSATSDDLLGINIISIYRNADNPSSDTFDEYINKDYGICIVPKVE